MKVNIYYIHKGLSNVTFTQFFHTSSICHAFQLCVSQTSWKIAPRYDCQKGWGPAGGGILKKATKLHQKIPTSYAKIRSSKWFLVVDLGLDHTDFNNHDKVHKFWALVSIDHQKTKDPKETPRFFKEAPKKP